MIVLNLEPKNYSNSSIKSWKKNDFIYKESSWSNLKLNKKYPNVEIIIIRLEKYISNNELAFFPNLKNIICATTGSNHIDLELLKELNIRLFLLKGHDDFLETIPSTAEFSWGLLMCLIKKIPFAYEHVKQGGWNRDLFIGNQLKSKKIGIVGLGRTGLRMAKYSAAFDMDVFYFDPYVNNKNYIKVNDFDELLSICDILSFHVHLNDETKHMLNSDNIHHIKKNSLIINTSRGEILEEKSVVNFLKNNRISGVATDVIEGEFINSNSSLLNEINNIDNIIITPHIGGASYDAMRACEDFLTDYAIKKIKNKLRKK